jgi:hypothetical protein
MVYEICSITSTQQLLLAGEEHQKNAADSSLHARSVLMLTSLGFIS